ncbi:hypothetical protein KAT59_01400, partial [Candidatus Bipolaricaulota bacterium]|nr:hypothetical protein [Candidatus Bipolaricaulota bacterium]
VGSNGPVPLVRGLHLRQSLRRVPTAANTNPYANSHANSYAHAYPYANAHAHAYAHTDTGTTGDNNGWRVGAAMGQTDAGTA